MIRRLVSAIKITINKSLSLLGYIISKKPSIISPLYSDEPFGEENKSYLENTPITEEREEFEITRQLQSAATQKAVAALIKQSQKIVVLNPSNSELIKHIEIDTTLTITTMSLSELEYRDSKEQFDLTFCLDDLNQVENFTEIIDKVRAIAPASIFITTNRAADPLEAHHCPPTTPDLIREWNAGEFYWILRSFYGEVQLFAMDNPYVPWLAPVNIFTRKSPLIAYCRNLTL